MMQNLNNYYTLPIGNIAKAVFTLDDTINNINRTANLPEVYNQYKHKASKLLTEYPGITFD